MVTYFCKSFHLSCLPVFWIRLWLPLVLNQNNQKVYYTFIALYQCKSKINYQQELSLTHYSPVLLFYTPWKHQKTFRFSDVFRGYRKVTPDGNRLILRKPSLNASRIWEFNIPKYIRLFGDHDVILQVWQSFFRNYCLEIRCLFFTYFIIIVTLCRMQKN